TGSANVRIGKNTMNLLGNGSFKAPAGATTAPAALHGLVDTGEIVDIQTATIGAAAFTPDPTKNGRFVITVTAPSPSIAAPAMAWPGMKMEFVIRNSSGGAIALSWNAIYKQSFTNPAATKSRTVQFTYDGTNWVQTYLANADVPN